MMKKSMLSFIVFVMSFAVFASDNIHVSVLVGGEEKLLDNNQSIHLYSHAVGYLATCHRLEDIVRDREKTSTEILQNHLSDVRSGDHIQIRSQAGKWVLPLLAKNQEIEEIYVGFTANNLPDIVTKNGEHIQLYSKCMGLMALANFPCDPVISELMQLTPRVSLCENIKTDK